MPERSPGCSQPDVDPARLWIISGSRGTEAAVLVAAHWPELVHGVVAAAPSSFANGAVTGQCHATSYTAAAWSFDGKPIPDNTPLPVHKLSGPVMLVSGGKDLVWPSELHADQISAALPRDGAAHVSLTYPRAGTPGLRNPIWAN